MVTLEQIWTRAELALEIIVDSPTAAEQNVTIVHSSELPEVDEWLAGGEVLLTIGVGQDLGGDTVGDYVRRLKTVGVHALGIGLGSDLPWQQVPPKLVSAARNGRPPALRGARTGAVRRRRRCLHPHARGRDES
jgi:purine catabolism regulator